MEIFAFYAGIVSLYTASLFAPFTLILVFFIKPKLRLIFCFLMGLLLAYLHQSWVFNSQMPKEAIIQKAILEGNIDSIPIKEEGKISFDFVLRKLNDKGVNARIRLSCYQHCADYERGEAWQFLAKIKRARNLSNPGSFDYSGSLIARHIEWTGYIKSSVLLRPAKKGSLDYFRESLANGLDVYQLDKEVLGIIEAVTLGFTHHLNKDQWKLFRETGTTHLMVISGSHIVLIAGFFYFIVLKCWSLSYGLCLRMPAPKAASIIAIIVAFIYSFLSGFSIPVQRSLFSYCLFALRHFLSRPLSPWQSWRFALVFVLMIDPHAVLFPGFYLSFFAVALLILSNQLFKGVAWLKYLYIQMICLVGLMPLTLYFFSYGAVNGYVANLIAIPVVGYLIVPLSLIAIAIGNIIYCPSLFEILSVVIKGLFLFLGWISHFSALNLRLSLFSIIQVISLCISLGIVFLIPNKQLKWVAGILMFTAFIPKSLTLREGEAKVDFLDVGQGLAVAIHTKNHTLIYDTGVKFYQGGDMGDMVILPYLANIGRKKIDKIVISHPDLDHRGGLKTLENNLLIGELLVDDPAFYHKGKSCHQKTAWDWDGIHFQFLPLVVGFAKKNNQSCVLKIETAKQSVLLTGDIEKIAERYLIRHYPKTVASDILLVPHHGSKTSSSIAFLKAVSPSLAIISAGFDNRYHFPHQSTLKTYQMLQIPILNTAFCGMISFKMNHNASIEEKTILKCS